MSEPNDPAYPFTCQGPTTAPEFYYGMTLRQRFVLAAMQGLAANQHYAQWTVEQVVNDSLILADATLAKEKETRI